jgi:phosphoribosylglycinamide formyltransferase-1
MSTGRLRIAVLVSGSGTNLQAILDAVQQGDLPVEIALVISNREGVAALGRAERAGVPTLTISHRDYPNREAFDQKLIATLAAAGVSLVVLAGFMRLLTATFIAAFPSRIINIHPALLPAFPGIHAVRQALAHGVKVAGCTVHFVDAETDSGPIIAQAAVPVLDDDDESALSARILREEHRILVAALHAFAEGRLQIVAGEPGQRALVKTRARAPSGSREA